MGLIIVNIIGALASVYLVFSGALSKKIGLFIFGFLLFAGNIACLAYDIQQYDKEKEPFITHTIKDVSKYAIDTNMLITGSDTTKTYNITYWIKK